MSKGLGGVSDTPSKVVLTDTGREEEKRVQKR